MFRITPFVDCGALSHVEEFDHLDDGGGDTCTGTEDGHCTGLVESVVVLRRNNAADYHHDVLASELRPEEE